MEWPEAGHQFGEGGAGLRGEDGAAVAEVIPPQVRSAGGLSCLVERLVQRRRRQVATIGGGEQQPVTALLGVPGEVFADHRQQVRWDRDVPGAGIALGGADDDLSPSPHHRTADLQHPGAGVDVFAAELGELTEPTSTHSTTTKPR